MYYYVLILLMRKLRYRLGNIITVSQQISDKSSDKSWPHSSRAYTCMYKYTHVCTNIYKHIHKHATYDHVKGSELAKVKPMNH